MKTIAHSPTKSLPTTPFIICWNPRTFASDCSTSLSRTSRFLLSCSRLCVSLLLMARSCAQDDPEAALPHLQMFLAAPAYSLASAFSVERLATSTKIVEVAAVIAKNQFVVISGWEDDEGVHPDALVDSRTFFFRLLGCTDFDVEVLTIMDDVQEVPTLHVASTSLDQVLRVMTINHCEIVGLVNDEGSVQSVVRYNDIFKAFVQEVNLIYFASSRRKDRGGRSEVSTLSNHISKLVRDDDNEELEIDDDSGGLGIAHAACLVRFMLQVSANP